MSWRGLFGKGYGVIDLPVIYDSWWDAARSSSLLVADPGPYRDLVPTRRRSAFHDEMRENVGDTDLSRRFGVDGPRVRFQAVTEPEPELVIRRVGRQARIESFDGQPHSGLMPVEDAIRALREALAE